MKKQVIVYGIKNCETMKKAFAWLDKRNVAYDFHDYKKEGADEAVLKAAMKKFGWENVLNRKGTTWRKLPEDMRGKMTEKSAMAAALDNPSLIKRPLVVAGAQMVLGFDEEALERLIS
jgi:Spx/MgsR family transcriptional regulator